jgi:hypothetical protein
MSHPRITHGLLHSTILQYIIDHGFGPEVDELASLLSLNVSELVAALKSLEAYHGVVLHPDSARIWVIHPFSLAPTNFTVRTADKEYWGNCGWCSLGVAALLNRDVTITTTLGADRNQIELHIKNGNLLEDHLYIHFPIPMTKAWDNVIYTCSTMLVFESASDVARWSQQHRIPQGDIQPIQNIWNFAKVWYGNHLNVEWQKWTNDQALAIFEQFGLTHDIWRIPASADRF